MTNDRSVIEKRWTRIYQNNQKSKFYSAIKNTLASIPAKIVLEYGCSIGLMSNFLADTKEIVFGIDRSFSSISVTKKSARKNTEYIIADSTDNIFGKTNFELILTLNLLELVEPTKFLKQISSQIKKGYAIITDPYDYDRGIHSVKKPLDDKALREYLVELGFQITNNTQKPCFIPWNLWLNHRASLNYKVDLIIARRVS